MTPAARIAAAERQRKARRLRKVGRATLRIEVDHDRLLWVLVESKRLSPEAALRPKLVEVEVGEIVDAWSEHWLRELQK